MTRRARRASLAAMSRRLKPLDRLEGDQLRASAPRDHAALSASAGTGKTHVLTARVLRLLLAGVDPASILCLTFTKAGAAEMAGRIHARLAYWVRLKDEELGRELIALGEDPGPAMRARARTLFARVLETAGGGLRIQTIHAFAQSLLAAFPSEAGLIPGFRPLEGREEQALARATLAELLVQAEEGGDLSLIADVQALSLRLGESGAEAFLKACAAKPEGMIALGPREGVEARLRHIFGLPLGDIEAALADQCAGFDDGLAQAIATANRAWGAATGLAAADRIAAWLALDGAGRSSALEELAAVVLTKAGDPRKPAAGLLKADPDYDAKAARLTEACARLLTLRKTAAMVASLAAGAARRAKLRARLRRRQAGARGGRLRRSDPRGRAPAAHPRHQRMGALQARPPDRPYPGRRGAGYQHQPVEYRARIGPGVFRRRGAPRNGTGRSSPSATTSRRSSAFRAPIRRASTSPAPGSRARRRRSTATFSTCRWT